MIMIIIIITIIITIIIIITCSTRYNILKIVSDNMKLNISINACQCLQSKGLLRIMAKFIYMNK